MGETKKNISLSLPLAWRKERGAGDRELPPEWNKGLGVHTRYCLGSTRRPKWKSDNFTMSQIEVVKPNNWFHVFCVWMV